MLAALDVLYPSEVDVIAFMPPAGQLLVELQQRGILVVPFEINVLQLEQQLQVLQSAIVQHNLQLLHANSLAMGRKLGKLAPHLDIPTSTHVRDIIKLKKSAINDLNQHQALLAVSNATRDFMIAQGIESLRIRTLHNGIDTSKFLPRPKTGWLQRELYLPEGSILAATIGQICLRKGQLDLANAAVLLHHTFPSLHFLLIGERHSQKQESVDFDNQITAVFKDAGILSHIHRLGYRDDMHLLLNEIDVVIHPARQEPLGRVLLEAASSGVPVVTTSVGGTSEILTDQHSAILVSPGNVSELASGVANLLLDQTLWERFTENARSHIQANFSISLSAENLLAAWQDVLRQ